MYRRLKSTFGYGIEAEDGKLGKVHDVYFEQNSWTIRYLVVDTGGFLGGRLVLISPHSVKGIDWEEKRVSVALTKEQVKGSPEVNLDRPLSRGYEMSLHAYYGWPLYWSVVPDPAWPAPPFGPAPDVSPMPVPEAGAAPQAEEIVEGATETDLRSAREMSGHKIHARDGEIGHVDDYIIEYESWLVRYVIVDTRDWLPGRKVLISPAWIRTVNWAEGRVEVDLPREGVERSPEYDPSTPPEPGYEERLRRHYGEMRP